MRDKLQREFLRENIFTKSRHQKGHVVWRTLDQRVRTSYFWSWLMTNCTSKQISLLL